MATEMSKRVPQWRQGTLVKEALPLRLTPTARRIIFLIAVMGTLAGGIAGLVSWLQPLPNPYFMPFWVVEYRSPFLPLNTAADRDRIAIAGGNYFPRSSTAAVSSLDRHLMTHELAGLAGRSPRESVVVYVCAYAGSDAEGVYIMPGDFDPDDPRSRIPLRELLGYLAACPANRQLLVLDIMWPVAEARLGILADEVAGCVKAELEQHPDPRRLVLCAASAGQVALRSEPLRRSAFGYYFEQALGGQADGFNSHNLRDGRVSVRELAAFVQARVGRWAWQARGKAQIPWLHGRGQDFELTAASTAKLPAKSLDKPPEYPAWLLAAWKLRDQWQLEGINHRFPRVYRQLDAQVLRSEWQWRYGGESSRMKNDLEARISQLQRRLRVADASLAAPTPRLLSIKLGHGQTPNAAAVAEIRALLDGLDPPDATLPPIAAQAKEIKLLQDFEQKTKDVDYPNLAEAAFEVLRQDGEPSAQAIRILDLVLRKRQPQCQFVETNFLHSMALLTDRIPAPAWPASAVHRGFHTVDLCCRAAARARPFRWIEPWFTLAAGQQHQASMFLDAPGYAPLSEAENLYRQATAGYEAVLAYQDLVGAAYYAFDDAGTFLPNSKNYLHANPSLAPIWWSACTAAKDLADVLETDPPVNDRDALAKRIAKLRTRAGMLQTRLQMLGQPFAADRLAELIAQCKRAGTGPIVLTEVNAILKTPIPNAENRTALWSAADELAFRLDSRVLALDAADNQRDTRETDVGAFVVERNPLLQQTAQLRLRMNLGILALGGVVSPELDKLARDVDPSNPPGAWTQAVMFRAAEELRHVWADVVRNQLNLETSLPAQDRLGRIVFPFETSMLLDDPQSNPMVRLWRQQHRQLWAWLGDYFRYELTEHPGSLFFQQAAGDYAAFADRSLGYLEIDGPKELPAISPTNPRVDATFTFHGIDTDDARQPAAIRWYQSDAEALVLKSAAQQSLANEPFSVDISWRSGADATGGIPVRGFMLELLRDGRSFHLPVTMLTAAVPDAWAILISPNPQQAMPELPDLCVRPLRDAQPFYLYVRNPGATAREVIVQLDGETPALAKATVAPKQTAKIALAGAASAPATQMPVLTKSPHVKVIDAVSSELLAERSLDAKILIARDYVQITAARFQPQDKGPNRLMVAMRDIGIASGPPSIVELVLPSTQIPGLETVGGGATRGVLTTDGAELTLFASNLIFSPGTREQGRFYLTVDDRKRSFIFDATFARQGDATTAQEQLQPSLTIRAALMGRAGPGFPVDLEVNCPPVGATLDVSLGRGDEQSFQADLTRTLPSARDDQIRFSPSGPGGAMLVQASSHDWLVKLDTTGLSGKLQLRARLLNNQGQAVRTVLQPLTLDDTPPTGLEFDAPRAPVAFKTPFVVRAIGSDSLSGISAVSFFVGPPVEGKIPPGTSTVEAHAQTPDKTVWSAEMTFPEAPVNQIQISAQFTNGAGLNSFTTTEVQIVSNAILNQGRIAGRVMEGPRPQAGLTVVLRTGDAKGPEHSKTVTQADGSFVFDQLTPGSYTLSTSKPVSYRQAEKQVQVTAGQTADAQLELSIVAPTAAGA